MEYLLYIWYEDSSSTRQNKDAIKAVYQNRKVCNEINKIENLDISHTLIRYLPIADYLFEK